MTETEAKVLARLPSTGPALVTAMSLSKDTVFTALRGLHAAKKIYVADYAEDSRGRLMTKVWAVGRKADKPRPGQRRTGAERMRALREKRRALEGC